MDGNGDQVKVRQCRECGCSDARACPGGCFWVAEDLCSRCVTRLEVRTTRQAQRLWVGGAALGVVALGLGGALGRPGTWLAFGCGLGLGMAIAVEETIGLARQLSDLRHSVAAALARRGPERENGELLDEAQATGLYDGRHC